MNSGPSTNKLKTATITILAGILLILFVVPLGKADVSLSNQFIQLILQNGQTQDPFTIKNATGSTLVRIDVDGGVFSQSINATNITAKNIGGVVYADQYLTGSTTGGVQEAINALTVDRTWKETVKVRGNLTVTNIHVPSYTVLDLTDAHLTLNSTVNGDINGNGGCAIEVSNASYVEVFGGHIDGNGANSVNGFRGMNPSCGV